MSHVDPHPPCLVLMLKAPVRSKRRLVADFGSAGASTLAERLIACALEDLAQWPGPVWAAPASDVDRLWLMETGSTLPSLLQPEGNLGARIGDVGRRLHERGEHRQIFIGADCPELDLNYLREAGERLAECDVVLGPAVDGGVVLMGARREWPDLEALPWSTEHLHAALDSACRGAGLSVATLNARRDVDTLDDLLALEAELRRDPRPARVALGDWIASWVSSARRPVDPMMRAR